MIDLSNYNVYKNKDGRWRAYNKTTHKVTSYPRIIMESILVWTAQRQRNVAGRKKTGPFCSKRCVGINNRRIQMKKKINNK